MKRTISGLRAFGFGAAGLLLLVLVILALIMPPVWKLSSGPISILRWPKSGAQIFVLGPGLENWVPIKTVSHHVIHAIVVAEDARFYEHFGLDLREIRTSIEQNFEQKRYARGASTLTQQVVKMAFLGAQKSLLRKVREAMGALLLEQILNKDEILAWYINLVEFGDGVFGIKAAAEHFFQTTPELLTIQDGAHLALVLPSPNRWSKGLRQRELTGFGHRRYAQIIDEMYKHGYITATLRQSALATGDFGRPIVIKQTVEESSEIASDAYDEPPSEDPSLLVPDPEPPLGERQTAKKPSQKP